MLAEPLQVFAVDQIGHRQGNDRRVAVGLEKPNPFAFLFQVLSGDLEVWPIIRLLVSKPQCVIIPNGPYQIAVFAQFFDVLAVLEDIAEIDVAVVCQPVRCSITGRICREFFRCIAAGSEKEGTAD